MTDYRVDCINKPGDHYDPYTRIQRLGGTYPVTWNGSENDVIDWITQGHTFFVERGGRRAAVIIDRSKNPPCLKTEADSLLIDNLLSLPECH